MHDFGIQSALPDADMDVDGAARGVRGRVRPHLPRRGRERRLQPPGRRRAHSRRRDRRPARVCEVHAADRLSAVADLHRDRRWPRMPAIARMLVALFKARFDPERARARARARPSRSGRSRPRSRRSRTCPRIACLRQYLALHPAPRRARTSGVAMPPGKPRTLPVVQVRSGEGARACPSPSRCSRSSSTRRASKACTCAAAASRAAACAGRTGPRTSAPRCSGSSRRRW